MLATGNDRGYAYVIEASRVVHGDVYEQAAMWHRHDRPYAPVYWALSPMRNIIPWD